MAGDFQARWAAFCQRSGAINSRWLCVRTARRGRLIVAHRWRTQSLASRRALGGRIVTGTAGHSRITFYRSRIAEPLLCDPALVSILPQRSPEIPCSHGTHPKLLEHATEDSRTGHLSRPRPFARRRPELPESDLALAAARGICDLALSLVAREVLRGFAWRLPGLCLEQREYLDRNFLDTEANNPTAADRLDGAILDVLRCTSC